MVGIAINDNGVIWFGGYKGLIIYYGVEWKSYTSVDGYASRFNSWGVNSDCVVWGCAHEGGILRFDDINKRVFTTDDGIYDNYVS